MLALLGALYLRLVSATSRTLWLGRDVPARLRRENRPFVYAFWHARQAMLAFPHRREPAAVLVSRSRDGGLIAGILGALGLRTVRGSSSRGGGAALLELLRLAEAEGLAPGITPDGPKGPPRRVKPGALFLAQRLKAPIVPVAAAARRKLVFRSWDAFQLPLPFNRIVIAHGEPVAPPEGDLKECAARLERALDEACEAADREAEAPGAGAWLWAYNALFPLLALGLLTKLLFSSRRRSLAGLAGEARERLGAAAPPPDGRQTLWFHAASVGEARSLARVIPAMRASVPEPWVVVTTSTSGGKAEASRIPGVDEARLAPLDIPWIVGRAVGAMRPRAFLIAETELWPNTMLAAARAGARIFILNARMSAKSARRYAWIGPLLREPLAAVDRVGAQTEADRERFEALGARPERLAVTGNLKHDLPPHRDEGPPFEGLGWNGSPVLVAGSTHEGEEAAMLEAFAALRARHPRLKLVLAPRHVERAPRVAALVRGAGFSCAVWSERNRGADPDCLVIDRIGELQRLYGGATAAFVGGTIAPRGGHNLLEPARLGKPVLFGPHTESVLDFARSLLETGGGRRVASAAEVAGQLGAWLESEEALGAAGERAKQACRRFQGATRRTLELVLPRL